jgi:hypothetical protein
MAFELSSHRSLFTGQIVDSEKPLYVASLVNNISVSTAPFIFLSQENFKGAVATTLDDIDVLLNGMVTTAMDNFITPLIDKNYSEIDRDDINYINLVNALLDVIDDHEAVEIIVAGVKAARLVAQLNDNNLSLIVQKNDLQTFIDEELYNLQHESVICPSGEQQSNITLTRVFHLAPLYKYYHIIYGVPSGGEGYDTQKLGLVLIYLENNNIHPFKQEPEPEPEPEPGKEPFAVNGYYPLYSSLEKIPDSDGILIDIDGVDYYMQNGVKQYFGDFDEHELFRIDDTFDGLKKDWLNDTSEGEVLVVPAITSEFEKLDISYSFGNV